MFPDDELGRATRPVVMHSSPVTFEDAVNAVRVLRGSQVSINLTNERYGRADGYIADFSGLLTRVDDPIPGVDAPVHYFRFADDASFALFEPMFDNAAWVNDAGLRVLRIELRDGIVITVLPTA